MVALRERASFVKDSLHRSQTITDNMVSILSSFDHCLSALETAIRPTQIKMHSIRSAHDNIDKTLKAEEVILTQFDQTCKVEAKILRGPHEDLESYLGAVDQLRANVRFFSSKNSFKSSDGIISHENSLLAKAMLKLEDEFKHLLTNYSKPVELDRLFDYLPNSIRPSASGQQSSGGGKSHSDKPSIETITFTLPTLIPPKVIPLLHELAQQMVQAGHQQQLFRIYTNTHAAVLDQSLRKLGVERLTQETFGDFEEAVEKDATKTVVQDGSVHPLTSYVINYVKFLYDYQETLKQLFQEFDPGDPEAQLASVTTRICNADYKKKTVQFSHSTNTYTSPDLH
ncbi:hypothetical protein RYX36_004974 [Vicia faba]